LPAKKITTFKAPTTPWQEGLSRLLDYGVANETVPTALFVSSLINRSYILGISRGRSLMRYLTAASVRPLLLKWGGPEG
jgi:polyhydroxyalkanoate synthase subunit PhaC